MVFEKSILKIVATILAIAMLFIVFLYEFLSPVYSVEELSVDIDGQTYVFAYDEDSNWRCEQLGERVGYIEGQPAFGRIVYVFAQHGLYRVKDDEAGYFYQIKRWFACKEYSLLVRKDLDLTVPDAQEVTAICCGENRVTDETTICALFERLQDQPKGKPQGILTVGHMKIYSARYSGIYYDLTWYRDENGQYFLVPFDAEWGQYVSVPNELMCLFLEDVS